ncbi:MAG TPA: glycosyltransferase family 4 protein [Acidimicrobiales bacterium]
MRVLIAHSWYMDDMPSGENRAVEEDIRELTEAGVEVVCARPERYGASLGGLPPSSKTSPRAIVANGRKLLEQVRPDLVHLHHPYPEYLATIRALRTRTVPLVHTVHNLRHVCPAGTAFRDGRPCTECHGRRLAVPCAQHRCVNGSLAKSLTLPLMVRYAGPTLERADVRIAPSEHMRRRLLETDPAGGDRIVVLPNAVADPLAVVEPTSGLPDATYAFFAGRLTETKGVRLLVEAFEGLPPDSPLHLVLAGDGPLRAWVEERAAAPDSRLHVLGPLPASQTYGAMRDAAVVVVPSIWDEPFGLVAAEALGCATPVLVTDRGALADIVGDCGRVVPATTESLRSALAATAVPSSAARGAARRRWELAYSAEVRGPRLIELYRDAIRARR